MLRANLRLTSSQRASFTSTYTPYQIRWLRCSGISYKQRRAYKPHLCRCSTEHQKLSELCDSCLQVLTAECSTPHLDGRATERLAGLESYSHSCFSCVTFSYGRLRAKGIANGELAFYFPLHNAVPISFLAASMHGVGYLK